MDDGVKLIGIERQRQVWLEGYSAEHDAGHADDALARAAACYALPARFRPPALLSGTWPWMYSDWKPSLDDRVRELVKAGALIAAEIDRLQATS